MADFLNVWKYIAREVTVWLANINIGGISAWHFLLTVFAASLICGVFLRAFSGSGIASSMSGTASGVSDSIRRYRRSKTSEGGS